MHRSFTLFWVVALVLLGGCTSLAHRSASEPCSLAAPSDASAAWESTEGRCSKSFAIRAPSHGVNYVEIDEQGMLHDRAAAEAALAFAGSPTSDPARMAYVVVFIHGWHHDASADDPNVQAFHSALAAVKRWRPHAEVRGIYVGWRGSSLPVPLLRYITFWERKNTSDEIGRGGLLEYLLRLEMAVKPVPESQNRLVLVGHSLGASVAFNALAHIYMQRFVDGLYSTHMGERFRGYGDLVVLINPAIEAMRYMPMQSAVEYYASRKQPPSADFTHEKRPKLIILSSDGDLATHCAFPVARPFSTALEAHNKISSEKSPDEAGRYVEWNLDRDTVGNFPGFRTHWPLRLTTSEPRASGEPKAPALLTECVRSIVDNLFRSSVTDPPAVLEQCRAPGPEELRNLLSQESSDPDEPAQLQMRTEDGSSPKLRGSYFPDSNIRFVRKPSTLKGLPYIVAGVDTEIVAGHSGIGSQNLICWISQIVDGQ